MDLPSSSASATAISYKGERGTKFGAFLQPFTAHLSRARDHIIVSKGKDLDVSLDLKQFLNSMPPDSPAYTTVKAGCKALDTCVKLARLGWLAPTYALEDEVKFVASEHRLSNDAEEIANRCFERTYASAYDAFTALGVTISDPAHMHYVLEYKLTPAKYQELLLQRASIPTALSQPQPATAAAPPVDALLTRVTAAANSMVQAATSPEPEAARLDRVLTAAQAAVDVITQYAEAQPDEEQDAGYRFLSASSTATVAAAHAHPTQPTVADQIVSAFQQLADPSRNSASTHAVVTTEVDGITMSLHAAASLRCFDLFYAVFAMSPDDELKAFYQLHHHKAQGKMTVSQFANHIMTVYNSVRFLGNVSKAAPLKAFRTGLNSAKSREVLKQAQAAATGTLSLEQMVDTVIVAEQREREDQLVDQNVELYTGQSAQKEAPSSYQDASNVESTTVTLEQRHESQRQAIADLPAYDQKFIELNFEIAATDPAHKGAICQNCDVSTRPHINADCEKDDNDSHDDEDESDSCFGDTSATGSSDEQTDVSSSDDESDSESLRQQVQILQAMVDKLQASVPAATR